MQFKEENYRLKLELKEITKKNEILELTIQHLQSNNINSHQKLTGLSNNSVILESDNENGEDFNEIKKEHNDLIERILCLNIDVKSRAKTRYLKAIEYINSIVQIVDIKKFYKDLHNQQNAVNTSMTSQTNDSNGKEKRSTANRSVEYDKRDSSRNTNNFLEINEKQISTIKPVVNRKKLDNLSPVKNHKIGTNTARFNLKK